MQKINQLLKFEPILKEKIWGGEKLISQLHKKSIKKNIGESWEISGVENDISIVIKGSLQGKNLQELIGTFKGDLVGHSVYKQFGDKFPLLIKFIDAKEVLSIQLHPNDALAKKRHNSFGKTEMWYVIQTDEKANLIVGLKEKVSEKKYLHHLENKTLLDILNIDEVKKDDVYIIPSGRIHAIGAGVLLAEIQQISDITYRIYDWDRKDVDGNYRELHTEEAIAAIDYNVQKSYKTAYQKIKNGVSEIVSCSYFTTNIIQISENTAFYLNHSKKDSFVIYMAVKGTIFFRYDEQLEVLKAGGTLLVPACINEIEIASGENSSEVLEIFIK